MFKENSQEYTTLLNNLKSNITVSQQETIIHVNKELFMLYWKIGNLILENQQEEECESTLIQNISKDLKITFPNMQSFSEKNLKYMCRFAKEYKEIELIHKFTSKISWSHNIVLMDKITNFNKRLDYINKILENNWSEEVLIDQIELEYGIEENTEECNDKIEISLNSDINVDEKPLENSVDDIPLESKPIESDNISKPSIAETSSTIIDDLEEFKDYPSVVEAHLPVEFLKDPYILDFLTFLEDVSEKELEKQLINGVTSYFLELNSGFAFVGKKYHLEIADEDYYIDLLFYNLNLRCYISIELKIGNFKPEYLGKLSFHLSLLDDILKKDEDKPSIGIILCKDNEKLVVQYAFKDINNSKGYAEYNLTQDIPEEFKSVLPTIKEMGFGIREKLKSTTN